MQSDDYREPLTLVLAIGRKGSGKTALLKDIVESNRHDTHFVVYDSTKEWVERPGVEVFKSHQHTLDSIAEYAIDHEQRSVLVVDEVHKYAPSGNLPVGSPLQRIVAEGRHLDTALLCASQRTSRVHTDLGHLADRIYLFSITGPNDLEWVGKVSGKHWAERCRKLETLQYLIYEP